MTVTNLLEQGATWLENQRHEHMTQTVIYKRGAWTVELSATIGRSEFEQVDEYGIVRRIESRDFLIRTTDLVLGAAQVLPKPGDEIRETVGDTTFIYEVMAPGAEPPYRYSDLYRKALRVHTKYVGSCAAE